MKLVWNLLDMLESEFSIITKMLRLPAGQVSYYDRGLLVISRIVFITGVKIYPLNPENPVQNKTVKIESIPLKLS